MTTLPTQPVSRRRFLVASGLVSAAVCLRPGRLFAEAEGPVPSFRAAAAAAKITVQPVRGKVSMVVGSGGNIGVLTGRDGKLLIDAGITGSRPGITAALASLGAEPVRHLVNTHWHFDHTDGNEWLHAVGAEITAHENTRKHLSEATRVEGWKHTFPPSPAGALPTTVFAQEHTLALNGEKIALKYYTPAHTDTDIAVRFTNTDILQTGDTWWNGHYPFIDQSTGGSIDGMIRATEVNLSKVGPDTLIIPGHGPVGKRNDLVEFRDMLVAVRAKVAVLKQQGRTLAEVVAARPTAAHDAKWGGFVVDGSTFASLVYADV
ncbi:MAG: MBL fold metallo-hydrolase [Verrucomicrobia bacterium]|nr:MBL fold metallo-hydrolase [Verrucomicrobiota bacterium]